jgi:hypothetical protein
MIQRASCRCLFRRFVYATSVLLGGGLVECRGALTRTSTVERGIGSDGHEDLVRVTVSTDDRWSLSSILDRRQRLHEGVSTTLFPPWRGLTGPGPGRTSSSQSKRLLEEEDGDPDGYTDDDDDDEWDDNYYGFFSRNDDGGGEDGDDGGGDDDAANWCSPDDAYKHYGTHYHLHRGNFQRAFGGYSCSCVSMDGRVIGFDCTSCVACEDAICTMRNVTLRTQYTAPTVEQGEALYVCTKFVNDFRPFRQVEICGIVHSPDSTWDNETLTTVSYSVNGELCASTERIACRGSGNNTTTGFLVDCSNAGYKKVMNTCTGSGLTGPWWFLYRTSTTRSGGRVKVNPLLTVGLSLSLSSTAETSQCPYYDDNHFATTSPQGRWVVPQVMTFASIVAIGSLYRTLS